ncbi:restriction endonuclease subunit S [Wohlfahrtiimonas chitiniclastica]|uniref:restriction endonuclease subunit S n=1 Tax=Wohlfahrtiimonas chitiniclastica TaxID=400946 RepID=UPI001BD09B12|nr:restriction endonuclease subunit S [Wohlfahrtiimonas chitiniclastica]MBS7814973.1 restriction endonuclease subunit S [Wohlfahrtiimonas chitiniclastica]
MAKTETHIPKLRFAGFAGYLDSSSLKEVALVKDGTHQTPEYTESGVKFLSVENIEKLASSNKFISEIDFENNFKIKPQLNDILMTRITAGEIGKTAIIKELPYAYYVSLALIRLNQKVSPNFFHQYAGSSYFKKELNKRIIHVAFPKKINLSDLGNCLLSYPSLQEQTKIGDFFQKIDQVIELQQKALDTARDYKKSMLQKMFPQKGEKVPQIRFDGFSGDWEETLLGKIAKITMGQSPDSANYTDNPLDHILVQGNADLKKGCVFPRIYTTQVTKTANKGDIILTVRAPVGAIAFTDFDVVLGRGVAGIKGNIFTYYILEMIRILGIWEKFSSGSTFDSINSNQIKEIQILIPTLEEQQKIGMFFQKLDQQIEQHEKKLQSYQNLKKAMLQRLFV